MLEKLDNLIEPILRTPRTTHSIGKIIGNSREGRPIRAFRFGSGITNVSLIAGCHADEPVGPRLLRHLTAYLQSLDPGDPLLRKYMWWIIPHMNPDGEVRNRAWYSNDDEAIDCECYLRHVVRENPGDDIEFGFPRNGKDTDARPENRAAEVWWGTAKAPFKLHFSLHGMAVGNGPWFLVEKDWWPRCRQFQQSCEQKVTELGYILHDEERHGEKGFYRLAKGFCSRPDSAAMRDHFNALGDAETAIKFRPSSMETIRSFGGDPLTLVSEMPLFILPEMKQLGVNPNALKAELHRWRRQLNRDDAAPLPFEGKLKPMPIKDQMILQWTMIAAGLAAAT